MDWTSTGPMCLSITRWSNPDDRYIPPGLRRVRSGRRAVLDLVDPDDPASSRLTVRTVIIPSSFPMNVIPPLVRGIVPDKTFMEFATPSCTNLPRAFRAVTSPLRGLSSADLLRPLASPRDRGQSAYQLSSVGREQPVSLPLWT
jgi:hypothetical protein